MSNTLKAAYWMIGAMFSFSLMAVSGRELGGYLDTFEIMMYRSFIGILIVSVFIFYNKSFIEIRMVFVTSGFTCLMKVNSVFLKQIIGGEV